jgi:ABC-2 type transport system ATP-binding protein
MTGVENPSASRRRRRSTSTSTARAAEASATQGAPPPTSVRAKRTPWESAIAVSGLVKRFGDVVAVDDLSFDVPAGQVVGFVGPNGSGKTTTIRMLMGLVKPDGGQASVLGSPITQPAGYLADVGALIEEPAFYPPLDARRNLLVHCRLRGLPEDRIPGVLAAVGLEEAAGRSVGGYSLGMKKRLAIAGALLPNPKLLVLDEPANGLDPIGMRDVRQLLRHLADQGRTVFVSSHLLSEVEQACDEVVMIQKGRLIFQGPLDELLGNEEAELVVAAEDRSHHAALRGLCGELGYVAEQRGDRVYVKAPASFTGELNRQAAANGITLVEIRRERLDLERVFFDLTDNNATEAKRA